MEHTSQRPSSKIDHDENTAIVLSWRIAGSVETDSLEWRFITAGGETLAVRPVQLPSNARPFGVPLRVESALREGLRRPMAPGPSRGSRCTWTRTAQGCTSRRPTTRSFANAWPRSSMPVTTTRCPRSRRRWCGAALAESERSIRKARAKSGKATAKLGMEPGEATVDAVLWRLAEDRRKSAAS